MSFNACFFLALRYLKPRWSFTSLITLLSVLGPILGVAVLIVVISVMTGFGKQLREKIFGMQAHLQLRPLITGSIEDPAPAVERLEKLGVKAVAVVEGPGLIQTRRQIVAKYIKGVDPGPGGSLADIYPTMAITGRATLAEEEAVVGRHLAEQYGLRVGDKLIVHATGRLQDMFHFTKDDQVEFVEPKEQYLPEELTVAGIFTTGMYDYDANIVFVHLEKADEIFKLPWGAATSIQVWAADPFELDAVLTGIRDDPAFTSLLTMTWRELNRQIFEALAMEKSMLFFLLMIIVIVAAFTIAGTLITVVIQKTREIGVMKALGASPLTVLGVFGLQGTIVGFVGVSVGTLLGLWIVDQRNQLADRLSQWTGLEIFPKELYRFSSIPAHVDRLDIAQITVSAFVICVLAALLPAFYAACMTPSKALHTENN